MSRDANEILKQEYLQARSKILELAAILDRIDRAPGSVEAESQMQLIREGIGILARDQGQEKANRAETVQRLLSRPYNPTWRTEFSI